MGLLHNLQCLWSLCPGEKSTFCISSPDVLCIQWLWTDFQNPIFVYMPIISLAVPGHVMNHVDWHAIHMRNVSHCLLYEWPPQTARPVAALESLEAGVPSNVGICWLCWGRAAPVRCSFSGLCLRVPAPADVGTEAQTVDLPLNLLIWQLSWTAYKHLRGCSTKFWVEIIDSQNHRIIKVGKDL